MNDSFDPSISIQIKIHKKQTHPNKVKVEDLTCCDSITKAADKVAGNS
jgi:hypothetical protein